MLTLLDSENADRDLTALVTVLTNEPHGSEHIWCQGLVLLGDGAAGDNKDLDGTGGNFELVVLVAGRTVQPSPQIMVFGTEVQAAIWTTPFPVPASAEVVLRVKSPNGADVDVDVVAYLFDLGPAGTLAAIADAVWDEELTGLTHNIGVSAGRRLREIEDSTIIATGTLAGAAPGTVTLEAGSSAEDNFYNHAMIVLVEGVGAVQARSLANYDGGTRVGEVHPNWVTTPNAATKYIIYAFGETHVHEIDDDVITLGTFDETTAWPLRATDAGATQVARVGADGDTLEILSDQIDGTDVLIGALNDISLVQAEAAALAAITAFGPNTVVPDIAGTAGTLHTATNLLITALNDMSTAQAKAAAQAALTAYGAAKTADVTVTVEVP